jgi:integrase
MPKERKAKKIRFTEESVSKLPTPDKGKRKYYHDSQAAGFCVCVTGTGTKTFYVVRKLNGKPEYIRIGRYPDEIKPKPARERAVEINESIVKGKNPNELKRNKRSEMVLEELFEQYMENHAKVHNRRPQNSQSNYKLYLSHWSNRKLSSITRMEVIKLHTKYGKQKGKVTANIAVKLLRAMFNKANEWDVYRGDNPAEKIKLFQVEARDRFLTPDELPYFINAVMAEPNETARDCILMALLTGARKDNLLTMQWSHIDLRQKLWRVPETKNGYPQFIPLVPQSVAILSRRKLNKESEWVFPGFGKAGHLMDPKRAFKRILEEAAIENFRFHDLRRTHGSYMAMTGANTTAIGKALGHRNPSSTAIYARLTDDSVLESTSKAVNEILKIAGEKLNISD